MTKYVNISHETHSTLQTLKKEMEVNSFNEVIGKLLDFEFEFNPQDIIYEYEYIFSRQSTRLFRVIYGDDVTIEYYSPREHEFKKDIKAWNSLEEVPTAAMNKFIKFIIKESSVYVLFEMESELVQNNIWIKRV